MSLIAKRASAHLASTRTASGVQHEALEPGGDWWDEDGRAGLFHKDGAELYYNRQSPTSPIEIASIEVPEYARRQGLATELFDALLAWYPESTAVNLVQDDAPVFWNQMRERYPHITFYEY